MAHLTGPVAYPQQTTETKTASSSQVAPIAFGTHARDASGNEYVYCDFQTAFAKGELCAISSAALASKTGATTTGAVGIVAGTVASSDLAGWVQVYGTCSFALKSTGTSSGPAAVQATTDGFSIVGSMSTYSTGQIIGLYIGSSGSSDTTTDYDGSSLMDQVTLQLNYPYVSGGLAGVSS